MPPDPIPPDVRRFLADVIRSVNELELLLLLREHAGRAWTPQDAAQQLYQAEGWVAGHLEALVVLGLAAREGGDEQPVYRYAPGDAATSRTIDALADAFARRRTRVIALIYRPEASSAERFADAFRLRRDDDATEEEEG